MAINDPMPLVDAVAALRMYGFMIEGDLLDAEMAGRGMAGKLTYESLITFIDDKHSFLYHKYRFESILPQLTVLRIAEEFGLKPSAVMAAIQQSDIVMSENAKGMYFVSLADIETLTAILGRYRPDPVVHEGIPETEDSGDELPMADIPLTTADEGLPHYIEAGEPLPPDQEELDDIDVIEVFHLSIKEINLLNLVLQLHHYEQLALTFLERGMTIEDLFDFLEPTKDETDES